MYRLNWLLLILWMLLLLAHSWYGPDIWYHLFWGRELVEFGRWIPQVPVLLKQPIEANGYWLFQSLTYLTFKLGGVPAATAIFMVVWLATAVLWLKLSQLWKNPLGLWLFTAFVVVMQMRFEQRPEVFSYFFLTLMTYLAWREKIWALFLAQILWTNCHGFFVLGPFVAAAVLYHTKPDCRRAGKIGAALLAATLINPFGYKVWLNVWLYLQIGGGLRELNHELFMPSIWPLYWPTTTFWLAWLATLAMIVHCLARKMHVVPAVLALGGLILGGQTVRNMPLLFLFAPLLWRGFTFHIKSQKWILVHQMAVAALALFMAVSTVRGDYHRWTGSLATFGPHIEWASYPVGAVEFLKKGGFRGKIFCDSYDGGYVEYNLEHVQIAGDSYFADPDQTKRFFAAIKDPNAFLQLNALLNFDALIINIENNEMMNMLLSNREWLPAYADSHRTVFVRSLSNPQFTGDLTQFTFYHGEDLKQQWTYEFGVISWMGLAYQRQDGKLIKKILSDLAPGKVIPATAFNYALKYSASHKDEEIVRMLSAFPKSED